MTGGTAGPEASVVTLLGYVFAFAFINLRFPETRDRARLARALTRCLRSLPPKWFGLAKVFAPHHYPGVTFVERIHRKLRSIAEGRPRPRAKK